MNILVTSAGRRGYIVEYFKEALAGSGKVYAGNSGAISSAFYYADECVVTPLIYDKEYIPFLLEYCKKKQITIIVPLFDIDLFVLAQSKNMFKEQGISIIVSSESVIRICNDKWSTYQFCIQNNILTAKTYLNIEEAEREIQTKKINFPVVIKPRWGMGSLAIYQADDIDEMKCLYQKCRKDIQSTYLKYEAMIDVENCVIIQEKLQGQEYGMDIINNLEGEFCCSIIRVKYAMRAGETDCAAIVKMPKMQTIAEKISRVMRHIGNMDVDLFVEEDRVYLLEMNARFGGGYPFSHIAGINLPKAIIKWIKGEKIENEFAVQRYNRLIQKDICLIDLNTSY